MANYWRTKKGWQPVARHWGGTAPERGEDEVLPVDPAPIEPEPKRERLRRNDRQRVDEALEWITQEIARLRRED